jgi:hypothetical protein
MADNTTVHIGENSPEYIAFRLLQQIAHAEDTTLWGVAGNKKPNRDYILTTYEECLHVVKGFGQKKK